MLEYTPLSPYEPVSQRSIVVIHTEIWISPMLHHVVCQGKALVSPSGEVD